MQRFRFRVIPITFGLCILPAAAYLSPLWGPSVLPSPPCQRISIGSYAGLSAVDIAQQFKYIIVGTIESSRVVRAKRQGDCDMLWTVLSVRVEKTLYDRDDEPVKNVEVVVMGGKDGEDELIRDGISPYNVGQRNVFFLTFSKFDDFPRGAFQPWETLRFVIDINDMFIPDGVGSAGARDTFGQEIRNLEQLESILALLVKKP